MLIIGRGIQVMSCTILSRSWYVGAGSNHVFVNESEWMKMCQLEINREKADKLSNQMASDMQSMDQDSIIMIMLYFIDRFHLVFFDIHIKWHQHVDDKTQEPGHLAVHMVVNYYVKHRDLKALQDEVWKKNAVFSKFCQPAATVDNDNLRDIILVTFPARSLDISMTTLKKHFHQWRKDTFLTFILRGEDNPAQFLACYFISESLPILRAYKSKKHDTAINIHGLTNLLTSKVQHINFAYRETIRTYPQATDEISCGASIFDNSASDTIKAFLEYVKDRCYPFLSNTHNIKAMVKD